MSTEIWVATAADAFRRQMEEEVLPGLDLLNDDAGEFGFQAARYMAEKRRCELADEEAL